MRHDFLALVRYISPRIGIQKGLILCLLYLGPYAGAVQSNDNAAESNSYASSPNIYVDYDRSVFPTPPVIAATNGLGCWIWDRQTLDKQTIHLWRSFTIPKSNPATNAELRISADNAFRVWMDGQEIGNGSDWRTLSIYELSGKLNPGTHVLAIEGFNDCDKAGVIVGMTVTLANGQILHLQSDKSWRVVPISVSGWRTATQPLADWRPATFVANLRQSPWWATPKTVAHVTESFPDPIPLWRTPRFQVSLFAVCGMFIVIGLYLLIQLVIQSKTHSFLEIERDRIARDIHDDLGSKITQLLLTGEASQIQNDAHARGNAKAEPILQMCEGARDILTTIDEIIWIVNSQHNTLNDFAIHVCKYTERFLEATPIRFRFDVDYELPSKTLPQLARRNLFLAVKEALNNAVKHSHATELTVQIKLDGSMFIVIVRDNGIGFDHQQISPHRHGLNNMMLRMKEISGSSSVQTQRGGGCEVCLCFSLKKSKLRHFLFKPAYQNDFGRSRSRKNDKELPIKEITYTDKH